VVISYQVMYYGDSVFKSLKRCTSFSHDGLRPKAAVYSKLRTPAVLLRDLGLK
jgi:hypothetical protein